MRIILKNFVNTLLHYKVSSILNVVGLALAFASMYILLVQVNWELTYNHSIEDADRVFAVEYESGFAEGQYDKNLNRPDGEAFIALTPYIEVGGTGASYPNYITITLKRGDKIEEFKGNESSLSIPFLDVFGFESLSGDVHNISKPGGAAIPASKALAWGLQVGDAFYLGKGMEDDRRYEVVAIYKDFKDNTTLSSNPIVYDMGNYSIDDSGEWSFHYYVKLKSADDKERVEAVINEKIRKDRGLDDSEDYMTCRLMPIKELYFETDGREIQGDKNTVYSLLVVAILIVVIALINFINFFYALIPVRIRKVNTLKIFGSPLYALRLNFVVEALGLVFIALLIAWYIVYMVQLSSMSEYISTSLSFDNNPFILGITLLSAFVVAFAASVYPAYYITSFPMAFAIKGSFAASKSGKLLRTSLLGIQFVISISLIVASIFVRVQHDYMMNYNMGFNKENILSVWMSYEVATKSNKAYQEKLLLHPQIKDVTTIEGDVVAEGRMGWGRDFKGVNHWFQCFPVSSNFLDFMGIKMVEGRGFMASDDDKPEGTFIFNETAQKEFNITLGDKISGHNGYTEVVGICKDFNFKPLQYAYAPLALYVYGSEPWRPLWHVYVRTAKNADIKSVIEYMKSTMVEFDPTISKEEVDVVFFDEELGRLYYKEEKLTTLITLFSIVSIVISLMGVFGLVLFETQYRRKEIGIRRVHGASRREILAMFNRKYITLVLVCFVIAVPISYYLLHQWVSRFAYRAPMAWWIFALALLLVLLITIATVTTRSMKAANEDPANSIKTE